MDSVGKFVDVSASARAVRPNLRRRGGLLIISGRAPAALYLSCVQRPLKY